MVAEGAGPACMQALVEQASACSGGPAPTGPGTSPGSTVDALACARGTDGAATTARRAFTNSGRRGRAAASTTEAA